MDRIVADLLALADYLDECGFHKLAAEIDEKLKEKWESAGNRPPEETASTVTNWETAFSVLREELGRQLDPKVAAQALSILDKVSAELVRVQKQSPKTSRQMEAERADKTHYVSPNIVTVAESVTTLAQDIEKAQQMLQDPNLDPQQLQDIQRGVLDDRERIQKNLAMARQFATPDEISVLKEYIKAVMSGNKGSVVLMPERRKQTERRQEG